LRDEALQALSGSDIIVHAGDIGSPEVIQALERIAPVCAVRGNNDRDEWGRSLPLTDVVELGEHLVYLLHDIADLDLDPAAAGFAAVIYGHSHKPRVEEREGVMYLNPGSAGPRRFRLPIAVARIQVSTSGLKAELVDLEIGS
jgi:putative phosphoesterase